MVKLNFEDHHVERNISESSEGEPDDSFIDVLKHKRSDTSLSLGGISFNDIQETESCRLHSSNLHCEVVEDRRIRRQIANCNERRRMQSINQGFNALRQLLPKKDSDKMSKAAILQQAADFIQKLLDDRKRLTEENEAKRRKIDDSQESLNAIEYLKIIENMRITIDGEKRLRMCCEKELADMKTRLHSKAVQDASNAATAKLANQIQQLLTSINSHQSFDDLKIHSHGRETATEDQTIRSATTPSITTNLLAPTPFQQHPADMRSFNTPLSFILNLGSPTTAPKVPIVLPESQSNIGAFVLPKLDPTNHVGKHQHDISNAGSLSQRNLQAILEAVRHLEGGLNTAPIDP